MLLGEFEVKLTDKNRLAVPSYFRKFLEGKVVLSRGYEGCSILLDEARFDSLVKTIEVEPILNLSVRDSKRFILGGASVQEFDKQGRIILPSSLIAYAELGIELSLIGLKDWIEVWDKRRWLSKLKTLTENASDIAEELVELNNKK